jgi:hypothetical protein
MTKILKLFAFSAAAAFLFSCSSSDSGGSNSGGSNPKTKGVSGIVIDPPIKDARIELKNAGGVTASFCGENKNLICQDVSGKDGTFTIPVPFNENLSGYYLVTYGGVDTVYGTDFLGISLYSPLELFEGGNKSVIISPATSLAAFLVINKKADLSDAVSAAANALKLTGSEVSLSPLDNAALLKASYLAVKTAELIHNEGAADPLAKIAAAAAAKPSSSIAEGDFLDELFALSGITDAALITSLKSEVQSLDARLAGIPISGGIDEIAKLILTAERKAVFVEAVKSSVGVTSTTTLFDENVMLLYDKLAGLVDNLPTNQFAASQLVRYVIQQNNFFNSGSSYTDPTFESELSTLIPLGKEAEFKAAVAAISKESIYFVNAPLGAGEALGNDNEKRVNYYFRSNVDINYKARTLISKVFNDTINDAIVTYVVRTYATYGLHERAYEIAGAAIKDDLNRSKAYRLVGHYTANYDITAAEAYLDKAKQLLDTLLELAWGNSSSMGNITDAYVSLSSSYSKAKAYEKSLALKNKIVDDILPQLNDTTNPTRFTLHSRVITSLTKTVATSPGLILELINAGDIDTALEAATYANNLIDALPAGTNVNNPYSTQILCLTQIVDNYKSIIRADSGRTEEVKGKIGDIYTSMEYFSDIQRTPGAQWMIYYGNIAGIVYWALGPATGMEFFNKIDPDTARPGTAATGLQNARREGAYGIAAEIAVTDGFDAALAFYNGVNPLNTTDYSNLTESYGWVDAFTFYNDLTDGIGVYAYKNGFRDVALAAANKAMEAINGGAAYYIAQGTSKVDSELASMVTPSANVLSSRYAENGYLKAVKLYLLLGEKELAKTALASAKNYVDQASRSFNKSKAYAAIGYYYGLAGDLAGADAAFAAAAGLDASGIDTDLNRTYHYVGLAYDASSRQVPNKETVVRGYLASAETYADLIGTTDSTYASEVTVFGYIAEMYATILDGENALASLEKAKIAANGINAAATKLTQYNNIIKNYAKLGYVDLAFEKAKAWISLEADQNNSIKNIAETVAAIDDFPDSNIAFSDTDKDGKPDFFVPWATGDQITASGLTLDDDIDGDGFLDTLDLTPFYAN